MGAGVESDQVDVRALGPESRVVAYSPTHLLDRALGLRVERHYEMRDPDVDKPALRGSERSFHRDALDHLDGHAVLKLDPVAVHHGRDLRVRGLDDERRPVHHVPVGGKSCGASSTVATRAVRRAVGVEEANTDTVRIPAPYEDESVDTHAGGAIAHVAGYGGAFFIGPPGFGDHEVVPGSRVFAEIHQYPLSLGWCLIGNRGLTEKAADSTTSPRPSLRPDSTRLHGGSARQARALGRGAGEVVPLAAHAEATARPCRARLASIGHRITSLRRVGHRAPHRCHRRSCGRA